METVELITKLANHDNGHCRADQGIAQKEERAALSRVAKGDPPIHEILVNSWSGRRSSGNRLLLHCSTVREICAEHFPNDPRRVNDEQGW